MKLTYASSHAIAFLRLNAVIGKLEKHLKGHSDLVRQS